ncbi:MAG: ferritin-like domain-containing protein [Gemmatimonadales bacterium]
MTDQFNRPPHRSGAASLEQPFVSPASPAMPSRRQFLLVAGGASATMALAACSSSPGMTPPLPTAVVTLPLQSDTDILKFALFLELLESDFYNKAVASGVLSGGVAALAASVKAHENTHVGALQSALGTAAFHASDVSFDFGASLATQSSFLATAQALEETGVSAYLGALGSIQSRALRVTAGSIFTIEARHAAAFRAYNNSATGPVPAAFEVPKTPAQIVAIVQGTGFVKKGL